MGGALTGALHKKVSNEVHSKPSCVSVMFCSVEDVSDSHLNQTFMQLSSSNL